MDTPGHYQSVPRVGGIGVRGSMSTESSEQILLAPVNVKAQMHAFFDELFTRLMHAAETKLNEKIGLIKGTKQMAPELKGELVQFLLKADQLDNVMNHELNDLEADLMSTLDEWSPRQQAPYITDLLQAQNAETRLENYQNTREHIQTQLETFEDLYRARFLENVKSTYCRSFTESLPSLKAPGVGPRDHLSAVEQKYNQLQSMGPQNSSYSNEEVHIHNTESYLARIDAETDKALRLRELFCNLLASLQDEEQEGDSSQREDDCTD